MKLPAMKLLTMNIYAQRSKLLLFFLLIPRLTFCSWYEQKLEGWYYFQEPAKEDSSPGKEPLSSTLTPEEAEIYLAKESRSLKQLLSLAIIAPTEDNVENYMRQQRQWIQRASFFAKVWGKVLLQHPQLSDVINTPTSSYGVLAKREAGLNERKALLQKLSHDHFLLFFFKGSDPLSKKAAEVAELFASTNHWKLKAISLDGIGIEGLDPFEGGFSVDQGISAHFGVQVTPCFYIVNPKDNQAYPVGAGLIAVSELEENIEHQMRGFNDAS